MRQLTALISTIMVAIIHTMKKDPPGQYRERMSGEPENRFLFVMNAPRIVTGHAGAGAGLVHQWRGAR